MLQEQVVENLCRAVLVGRTAGRGRQDMDRWWPVTRMALFNSVGAEEPAYRVRTSRCHHA